MICNHGDNISYKLPDQRQWQGPAAVIGHDGKVANVNENHAGSDNDSYDDISVMPVNEVFVRCLESDEYFNTTTCKLDELKKWEHFEVYDEVKDVG